MRARVLSMLLTNRSFFTCPSSGDARAGVLSEVRGHVVFTCAEIGSPARRKAQPGVCGGSTAVLVGATRGDVAAASRDGAGVRA